VKRYSSLLPHNLPSHAITARQGLGSNTHKWCQMCWCGGRGSYPFTDITHAKQQPGGQQPAAESSNQWGSSQPPKAATSGAAASRRKQQLVGQQPADESSNLWGSSQPPRAANRWAAAYRQDRAAAGRQGTKDEQLSHKQTTVSHSESYSVRGISLHEGRAIEPKNGRIHISQRSAEVGESV
jgi:hypothetical protein